MEQAVRQGVQLQAGHGLRVAAFCVAEHVVPLQQLVQHDAVHEPADPHAEQ
ncbi:hypothetical protein WHH00_03455 [Pseudarthrobacter quantipunctorum]|uniref:Uncharacterized protein n=1 Tax=Pseudarthrobacter quantipunctorum TaxID=3128980 RepID=A0ABZ2R6X4_9MICC